MSLRWFVYLRRQRCGCAERERHHGSLVQFTLDQGIQTLRQLLHVLLSRPRLASVRRPGQQPESCDRRQPDDQNQEEKTRSDAHGGLGCAGRQ
jgi:hypothetical protein